MAWVEGMETFAARLASFDVAHPQTKRRASNTKASKALKWPHKSPSPAQLAKAGFFYKPTATCPDNAMCFLCKRSLDGWEEDDNPATEHLKHSQRCGWAINVCIEQRSEEQDRDEEYPLSEGLMDARRSTFADRWPHESKRGWTCKTEKMVEAGWYYCPTPESDDFVTCAYCNLSLDGWEPKDNPFDEHHRRSPSCLFFTMTAARTLKPTRAKKGRASKASRASTQSNFSTISDAPSLADLNGEEGNSILSTITTATTTSMAPKAGRKGSKAKKTKTGTKSKATRANNNEPMEVSSFLEPEDDDFEVKVQDKTGKLSKGRKRTSDEMEGDDAVAQHERQCSEDTLTHAPPPKRRALRTGSSLVRAQHVPIMAHTESLDQDIEMTDAESMPPPIAVPKKGTAGGRKRASSTTRKASTTSTASKASLRSAAPDDDEIDAALDAELDRPLTDDENADERQEEKPKGRRLTRTRPGSKKTTASVAPVRKATRGSTAVQVQTISVQLEPLGAEAQPSLPDVELGTEPQRHNSRARVGADGGQEKVTRKASARQSPMVAGAARLENRRLDDTVSAEAEKGEIQEREEAQTLAHEEALAVAEEVQMDEATLTAGETINKEAKETKPGAKAEKGRVKTKNKAETEPAFEMDLDQNQEVQSAETAEDLAPDPAPAPELKKQIMKSKKAVAAATKPKSKIVTVAEASSPPLPSKQATPSPSPQSSDAENQPPSSRPSATRPPILSPSKPHTTRVPLAASTPNTSPSKQRNIIAGGLQSTFPWTAVDLETIFLASPSSKNADKENVGLTAALKSVKGDLTSPEKKMSVEEWITFNASQGEERLRRECERLVGIFEGQGVRALRTLEGVDCVQ